jgi:hypothetical protein
MEGMQPRISSEAQIEAVKHYRKIEDLLPAQWSEG